MLEKQETVDTLPEVVTTEVATEVSNSERPEEFEDDDAPKAAADEFDDEEVTAPVKTVQPVNEYTGIEAQRDNSEGAKGNSVADLESDLDGLEDFDETEFQSALSDYDNFIILPKREVSHFLRAVEPLTKATVDQYGKAMQISCIDKDTVELRYVNSPYRISSKVNNKSGKMVTTFYLHVSLMKRLITESYASVAIVEKDDEYSIAVCDSLLFIETLPLSADEFVLERKPLEHNLDRELGTYAFRKIGPVLSFSDRASEKVIVVKDNQCYYNTGVFSARVSSPFGKQIGDVLLFKSAVDLLGILMDLSKVEIKYKKIEDKLFVESDGLVYCEMPITESIDDHFSPAVARSLDFKADIVVVNDSMPRLFSLVKSLDYLSDIVTVSFNKTQMCVKLWNQSMTRASDYQFAIAEGKVEKEGDMKVSADVMKPYLDVTGTDVRYAFNDLGLCMSNDKGSFIVRRTN